MTNSDDIKTLIKEQLPSILAEDASIRDLILRTVSDYYSPKQETDQKFEEFKERVDRILAEIQRDREEQAQKWDENNRRLDEFIHEQAQKWDEQRQLSQENDRKWQEKNQETLLEIKQMNRKYNSTLGALGSRWGLFSEASFRNALAGILEESFGVEVVNINDYDPDGLVFGRPDQVEVDVIIKNGVVIVCEIKSSMSKGDMYIFSRKAEFYQQKYQRTVNRKIVISPMVDPTALPVAQTLGIEVYSYTDDVSLEN
ncbi:MAG: PD-(D/E)XK nuclease family protein [Crocosphaera sp.]